MGIVHSDGTEANGSGHARLLPQHLADLRASGLSDSQIEACGFYSESDPKRVQTLIRWKRPAINLGSCLCFPFLDRDGNDTGHVMVKLDKPRTKKDKPVKYESPVGKPPRVYIPPNTRAALTDPSVPLLVTEGMKKAAKADQDGFPCLGLVGVYGWQKKRPVAADKTKTGPRELIPDLVSVVWSGRRVYLVFDSDLAEKPDVRWAEWHLAETLAAAGADVLVVRLPGEPSGAKVGIDDYLVAHGPAALGRLIAAATPATRPTLGGGDGRVPVRLGADEHRVNDAVAAELAKDITIYQRGGELVRVSVEVPAEDGPRISAAPRIEVVPTPALRDAISRRVQFLQRDNDGEKAAHPPAWCVAAVEKRGTWVGVRPLVGVVSFPALRRDGSILTAAGYDPATGLYLHWPCPPLSIPDQPTRDDAISAVATLLDAVGDFPFAADIYKAAWLAALLTPLARPSFDGPAPLFLVDANIPAAGKGLCLEVISRIVIGNPFPVISYPSNPKDCEEELRKKITTFLLYGDRIALFDNLTGAFGDGTLDRALTGTEWQDRRLGSNTQFRGPLSVTFYGTGNNVIIRADTARRVCHVRLESHHERPEERTDVKRPHLVNWVMENRETLLTAALTVLRAYHVAGRPDFKLKPWGSFEGWSALVRNTLVWCGLADPGETRVAVQEQADETSRGLRQLVAALEMIDPDRTGRTAAEIVAVVTEVNTPHSSEVREMVRDAIDSLIGKPDGRKLGNRLRHLRRRVVDEKYIDLAGEDTKRVNRWAVFGADRFHDRLESHPPHAPHPHRGEVRRSGSEDVEHVEDVIPPDAGTPADVGPDKHGHSKTQSGKRFGNNDVPHEWR